MCRHFLVGCVEILLAFGEFAEIALQIRGICAIIVPMTKRLPLAVNCPYLRQIRAAGRSRIGGFFRFVRLDFHWAVWYNKRKFWSISF